MKIYVFLVCMLVSICVCGDPIYAREAKGLDIYYIRHAETVANITGNYSSRNQRLFTEKGEKQRHDLVKLLSQYDFDVILVSPLYRARHTILPYLKTHKRTAEIWPELAECCWQSDRDVLASDEIQWGNQVVIEEENEKYFVFRDRQSQRFVADKSYADGIMQIEKVYALLSERFSQSGKSILLVGHGLSGARTIEKLLGREMRGDLHLSNATISHIRQNTNGEMVLKMLDGVFQERDVTVIT